MNSISINGKIMTAEEPALFADNRGYRYGDGLFETMKMIHGKIILSSFHFERLFASLSLLKFEVPKLFTKENLQQQIVQLCQKNKCDQLARVRLSVFRGNGGLYDGDRELQYIIECWPVNNSVNEINENGLLIDIFPDAKKSCDVFSNLKSANFLPYTMAALYAKENKLNDCLVLNTAGNIADTTIANIFIIKEGVITTPALNEGCVNGVMRRYLLQKLQNSGYNIGESSIKIFDIENADEVFLTNAINGIRWVKQFKNKMYRGTETMRLHNSIIHTILW